MQWKNQKSHWGMTAVLLHWAVAFTVFGMFALGWWMTDLDYYHPWYKQGPFIHKSIGILLALLVLVRLLWRGIDPAPVSLNSYAWWERRLAKLTHALMYLLLLTIFFSGYLISTADGRAISVFNWIKIPASIQGIDNQEDIAGAVHWYSVCSLAALVSLHIAATIKHQWLDKDGTLNRMTGCSCKVS